MADTPRTPTVATLAATGVAPGRVTSYLATPAAARFTASATVEGEVSTLETFITKVQAANCLYFSAFINEATSILATAATTDANWP